MIEANDFENIVISRNGFDESGLDRGQSQINAFEVIVVGGWARQAWEKRRNSVTGRYAYALICAIIFHYAHYRFASTSCWRTRRGALYSEFRDGRRNWLVRAYWSINYIYRKMKKTILFERFVILWMSWSPQRTSWKSSDQGLSSTKLERTRESKVIYLSLITSHRALKRCLWNYQLDCNSGVAYITLHCEYCWRGCRGLNHKGGQLSGKNVLVSQAFPPFVEV